MTLTPSRVSAVNAGVDIALAVDFVTMAVANAYDVGVIMPADTDLLPALEFAQGRPDVRQTAVAAWRGFGKHRRLRLCLWRHWLDKADYDAAADLTDYARWYSANVRLRRPLSPTK